MAGIKWPTIMCTVLSYISNTEHTWLRPSEVSFCYADAAEKNQTNNQLLGGEATAARCALSIERGHQRQLQSTNQQTLS